MKYSILAIALMFFSISISAQQKQGEVSEVSNPLEQRAYWLYLRLSYHAGQNMADFANIDDIVLEGESLELFKEIIEKTGKGSNYSGGNDIYMEINYDVYSCPECKDLVNDKAFQNLLDKYSLALMTDQDPPKSFSYNANAINVRSDDFVNYYAFNQELLKQFNMRGELKSDEHGWGQMIIGASSGSSVYYQKSTDEIVFYRWTGWGDCPAGCIYKNTYYTYYSMRTGTVRKEEQLDDQFGGREIEWIEPVERPNLKID